MTSAKDGCQQFRGQAALALIRPVDNANHLPRVGQEFQSLDESQAKGVLASLMDISGPFFQKMCHSASKDFDFSQPNVIVGSHEDFVAAEDINCYLYATDEYLSTNADKKYPGACLPPLTSVRQSDNCQVLKAHIFEEFGNRVRAVSGTDQCLAVEIAFTSYVSIDPVHDAAHDFHFTRHVTCASWHKPGQLPLEPVNSREVALPQKSAIYLTTTSNEDDALGFLEGIGLVKDVYLSAGVGYEKCHDFCLEPVTYEGSQTKGIV